MLVLLTISAAAVGVSVVIGADNSATAEITPESPEITLESPEITLESMEAEAELLDSGDVPVFIHCGICVTTMDCQDPANLGLFCQTNPRCKCRWCNSVLNCFENDSPF